MKPALELTSVPAWTVEPTCPDADLTGTSWTIVAIGPGTQDVVDTWCAQIAAARPDARMRVHAVADEAAGSTAVTADLGDALVGWRLMVAGPADACLRVRAHAVRSEVADDEMVFASTDVSLRAVHCVHCGTATRADVSLEDMVPCSGCGRNLIVYYHVSRRIGTHLGFMVDAEQPVAGA